MSLDTAKAIAVQRGLTTKFNIGAQAAKPFYPNVCTEVPSQGADEGYAMLGGLPGMREWVGPRKFNELRGGQFTLANKLWEGSLLFDKDNIADDRIALYDTVAHDFGLSQARQPDELFFNTLLANAAATACWDGQYFFDTDHSWGDSGTQSNSLTYDATSHTAVTVAEFQAAFEAAVIKLLGYKNDQGKLLNASVVEEGNVPGLIILVPLQLWKVATLALKAAIISNTTNINISQAKIYPAAYLTSAVKWYLFSNDGMLRPFIFQKREPLSLGWKGADDIETKDLKCMSRGRWNMGYGAWWKAVLTEFN